MPIRIGKPTLNLDAPFSTSVLSDVLHKVGHEIGNPLTSIISLATIIQRSPSPSSGLEPEKLTSYAGSIASEAWRITGITEKLVLILSDRKPGAQPVDTSAVLERALSKLRSRKVVDSDAILISFPGASVPQVIADADQLIIVVTELIKNANAASLENRPPTTDDDFLEEPRIRIETRSIEDNQVELRIINRTVTPIPAKDLGEVFQPLATFACDERHAGLGLTMCALLAGRMGGVIEISEEEADGEYEISVRLLLPEAKPLHLSHATTTQDNSDISNLSLLLVEDEPVVASAISRMLELSFGDAVKTSIASGEEAIARFERGEQFDVILCDLNLSDMSGRHVLETLQTEQPERVGRFGFLTGDQTRPETQRYLQSTGRPYLHKPFEAEQLVTLVRELYKEHV